MKENKDVLPASFTCSPLPVLQGFWKSILLGAREGDSQVGRKRVQRAGRRCTSRGDRSEEGGGGCRGWMRGPAAPQHCGEWGLPCGKLDVILNGHGLPTAKTGPCRITDSASKS